MPNEFEFSLQEQMPLRERVLADIRMAILTGKLKPNDRLVESKIAGQIGIGRGTLREALRQLEQEGLVISESYRHTRVAVIDEEAIREAIFPARQILEVFMVKKVAPELSEPDFANLRSIVEEMRVGANENDLTMVVENDIAFHQYLLDLSSYKNLIPLWQGMSSQIRVHFYKAGLKKDLHSIADEHEELLEALLSRDPERVADVALQHIHP
ncbi:MAG TPA: hypothetical protein DDW87_12075 [Firmicutes bacterium]|nr:hypothetical protein [Bacillota bacterium]